MRVRTAADDPWCSGVMRYAEVSMSYTDDIRGALAATSGASRRVQALAELKLPEADAKHVQQNMDEATEALLNVVAILKKNGHTAPSLGVIAGSAGNDKSWRETVYGGRKDNGTTTVMPNRKGPGGGTAGTKKKRSYEEVFPEETTVTPNSAPVLDPAHPWRTE